MIGMPSAERVLSLVGASVVATSLLTTGHYSRLPKPPVRTEGAAATTAVAAVSERATKVTPESQPAPAGQATGESPAAAPVSSHSAPVAPPSVYKRGRPMLTETPTEADGVGRPNPFVPLLGAGPASGPVSGPQFAPSRPPTPPLSGPSRPTVRSFQADFPLPPGFTAPAGPAAPSATRPSLQGPTAPFPPRLIPPPPPGAGMKLGAIVGRRDRVAIIEYAGQVFIVRVGDRVGAAIAAQILENKVVMRQGAATFDLLL